MHKIIKKAICLLIPLALCGCIGSAIFIKDADLNKEFPDLHNVPEKTNDMTFNHNRTNIDQDKEELECKEEWNENLKLRKQYDVQKFSPEGS